VQFYELHEAPKRRDLPANNTLTFSLAEGNDESISCGRLTASAMATPKCWKPERGGQEKLSVRRMGPDRLLQHLISDSLSGTVNDR
jgi:hypothetical protein